MIEVLRGDITTVVVDAVVNAANSALRGGGGVDGAIHRAAGPGLLDELMQFAHCAPGDAVITRGYRLPAQWVIHAVGPVWRGGGEREDEILRRAYASAFRVARESGAIRSIAFPAISTGVYGFPRQRAAEIAIGEMRRNAGAFDRIIACLFDAESEAIYRGLVSASDAGPGAA